jgi:hypothetical protein
VGAAPAAGARVQDGQPLQLPLQGQPLQLPLQQLEQPLHLPLQQLEPAAQADTGDRGVLASARWEEGGMPAPAHELSDEDEAERSPVY